jgi:hypothetical protein
MATEQKGAGTTRYAPHMNSIEAYIQFERYMAEFHGFIQRVDAVLPRNQ